MSRRRILRRKGEYHNTSRQYHRRMHRISKKRTRRILDLALSEALSNHE